MRIAHVLALLLPCLGGGACVNGLIYHHTVMPLTTNFEGTTAGPNAGLGDTKHFRLSYADVVWDSNGIGDIAKKTGLSEVDYADIERISILFGIWNQEWVHVYGR